MKLNNSNYTMFTTHLSYIQCSIVNNQIIRLTTFAFWICLNRVEHFVSEHKGMINTQANIAKIKYGYYIHGYHYISSVCF